MWRRIPAESPRESTPHIFSDLSLPRGFWMAFAIEGVGLCLVLGMALLLDWWF